MLMLANLIILGIAARLFFNALNEKRWVEAHMHDETVAADPGLLPDMSRIFGNADRDGSSVVDRAGVRLKQTSDQVKTRTAELSENVRQPAVETSGPIRQKIKGKNGVSEYTETQSDPTSQTAADRNPVEENKAL